MANIPSSFLNSVHITGRDADTLSKNIKNINSEDYSARSVVKEVVTYNGGSFVRDKREMRKFDEKMLMQFLSSTSIFEEMNTINKFLKHSESTIIGFDKSTDGIINLFTQLQKSVMEFSKDPFDDNLRIIFWNNLDDFVMKLNNIDNFIENTIFDIDDVIANTVSEFNTEVESVFVNNKSYTKEYFLRNSSSNDYADKIDTSLAVLQGITNLEIKPIRENEGVKLSLDGTTILEYQNLATLKYEEGKFYLSNNPDNELTDVLMQNKGQLAGYLKLKNRIFPAFKEHFSMIKETLVSNLNTFANNAYYKKNEITYDNYFEDTTESFGIENFDGTTLRISLVNPLTNEIISDVDVDFSDLLLNAKGDPLPQKDLSKISVNDVILKINESANNQQITNIADFAKHKFQLKAQTGVNIFLSGDLKINGKGINEFLHVNDIVFFSSDENGYKIDNKIKSSFTFQSVEEFQKDKKMDFTKKNTKILDALNNILTSDKIQWGEVKTEVSGLSVKSRKATFSEFINEVVLTDTEIISTYKNKLKPYADKFDISKASYLSSKQVDITTQQNKFDEIITLKEMLNKIYKMSNEVMKSLLEVI